MAALLYSLLSLLKRPEKKIRNNKYNLPNPKVPNLEIENKFVHDKAIFIIGDVHGCYDELCELMDLARSAEPNKEILFMFVGDIVNKGPKSCEVLTLIRSLGDRAFSVRGNHEEAVLREILKSDLNQEYVLPHKYQWAMHLSMEDKAFLLELPYTIYVPSLNFIVVHAGIIPGVSLVEQNFEDLVSMRYITFEDNKYKPSSFSLQGSSPWALFWAGPEHVYFGHHAALGLQLLDFATGLDTGCLYGGELTGVFANGSRQRLCVKAKTMYRKPDD
ncbi:hypothetical protein CHS0354_024857 [Potamilus streckersoni]|uniref:Calcineurin-like phosphoesterase domain-containing protein n=1 Tax=Potamilus streckersoni TaxID=2493646 RepID=A0AAE0SQC7_9BIVA|nr:hypothetical protein CHS0354_024857 [Potamilus streckersoni]